MGRLFNLPSQTVVGLQTRDDDINVGLTNTFHREFLSNTLFDHVNEGNVGIYAQNTTQLDRLVADHPRFARRLFCGVGEFDVAAGELRQS